MKKSRVILAFAVIAALCSGMTACAKKGGSDNDGNLGNMYPSGGILNFNGGEGSGGSDNAIKPTDPEGGYRYGSVTETPFTNTETAASSYFSLDRNTAGYSYVRAMINGGRTVAADSVRIEEMINYFDYSYTEPTDGAVALTTNLSPCPWNERNVLLTVGVKTQNISIDAENGNYVFLIDVSGSMSGNNRIGLAKYGFNTLVDNLGGGDVVSIVKYASGMEVVSDGVECSESGKQKIKNDMADLRAYGATNGAGGLELAYETAQKHFITGGNNRVIIISDGDFNVGKSGVDEMKEFIQEKAKSGIYLSVIGVGMDNTRDDMLKTLAECGNGNYAYLDNKTEAEKVFTHDLNGTLKTVAKDAKAGVTFTENVEKYRLVGYDTKHISKEEFENAQTDAGEIGSGLCTTAMYELTLKEGATGDVASAEIKYKDVRDGGQKDTGVATTVRVSVEYSADAAFAACVAEFGLILRNSQFKAQASLSAVYERLELLSEYTGGDVYKTEFVSLVESAINSGKYPVFDKN